MTMKERIIEAIIESNVKISSRPFAPHDGRKSIIEDPDALASTILGILREPTEAMVDAGVVASEHQSVSRIYRAMVGVALASTVEANG